MPDSGSCRPHRVACYWHIKVTCYHVWFPAVKKREGRKEKAVPTGAPSSSVCFVQQPTAIPISISMKGIKKKMKSDLKFWPLCALTFEVSPHIKVSAHLPLSCMSKKAQPIHTLPLRVPWCPLMSFLVSLLDSCVMYLLHWITISYLYWLTCWEHGVFLSFLTCLTQNL